MASKERPHALAGAHYTATHTVSPRMWGGMSDVFVAGSCVVTAALLQQQEAW
jgi:hypothetical protein